MIFDALDQYINYIDDNRIVTNDIYADDQNHQDQL